MKKFNQKIILTGLMLTLFSCGKKTEKKIELPSMEAKIPVKIFVVQKSGVADIVSTSGLVNTENEANYSFKIGGIINHINVHEGEYFKKGKLLAQLKPSEINAQVNQAKLAFEKAKRDNARIKNLYQDSVATLEQLQNAKTGLDLAQQGLDVVTFNSRYANIYAENDGFVSKKLANEGEVINSGTPILAINDTSEKNSWILKCGVTDKEWAIINFGDVAIVKIDALPQTKFNGTVIRKSQAAEQNGGSFQIEIKINLNQEKIATGMFGRASIQTQKTDLFTSIPYEAVIEADGNQAFVFIPTKNHKVTKAPIRIKSFNNKDVLVADGLQNISAVITSNSAFLNENSLITIIK